MRRHGRFGSASPVARIAIERAALASRASAARTAVRAAAGSDDDLVVGESAFDFEAEMAKDIERLAKDSPLLKEAEEIAASGVTKTEAQENMEKVKEAIDTFLLYDFFVILAILTYLIVGVSIRLSYGQGRADPGPLAHPLAGAVPALARRAHARDDREPHHREDEGRGDGEQGHVDMRRAMHAV